MYRAGSCKGIPKSRWGSPDDVQLGLLNSCAGGNLSEMMCLTYLGRSNKRTSQYVGLKNCQSNLEYVIQELS